MANLNKIQVIGNITKDLELKTLTNGTPVLSTTVAVNEKWKNKDGEYEESTEWVNVVLWRQSAEFASKYINKGDSVYVEGKMKTRSWEQDGVKKYATEVQASEIQIVKKSGNVENTPQKKQDDIIDVNDLPFN